MSSSANKADFHVGTIVIVGVGLIGGSIAKAVRQRNLCDTIIGVGRNPQRLQAAVMAGVIDEGVCNSAEAAVRADLIVVCTPVDRIAADVIALHRDLPATGLITDAGSTKLKICQQVQQSLGSSHRFVGAHPIAGSEKSGFEHARADLYEQANVVVTPGPEQPDETNVAQVVAFWQSLGARVLTMSAGEHDKVLALTSHLPHLVSSSLASTLSESDLQLAARGFDDTTRIAGGDPDLWTAIFLENAAATTLAAEEFLLRFQTLLDAIKDRQPDRLRSLLADGKRQRDLRKQIKN